MFAEGGDKIAIDAKLIVAADGAQSAVRSAFGVEAEVRDYEQTAVITTVLPQRFHDNVAYERFTPQGPLALLPLEGGRCTLVLTLDQAAAQAALAWSDQQFLAEVQRRFGFRLGRFLKVGRRVPYPLSLTHAERTSAARCVIIGNAAQGLHPVAGMGFNLGLRDVASLAELIAENARQATAIRADSRLLRRVRRLARCRPRRRHCLHRRIGAGIFQSARARCGDLRNLGAAGLRSAAAGESRAVALEHRERRTGIRNWRAAWRCT